MSDKVEQALRMLSGPCPHNRPDSEAPRTKPNCLQCLSETAREVIAKEIEAKILPELGHTEGDGFCVCVVNEYFKEAAKIARGSK